LSDESIARLSWRSAARYRQLSLSYRVLSHVRARKESAAKERSGVRSLTESRHPRHRRRVVVAARSSRNKDRPRRSLAYETKSAIKNTWSRSRRNLSMRGSTFPGRRVSTHRHTCLRKASSAYAAPRCRVLPSLRARSASFSLGLSPSRSFLSDAFLRVHRRLRDSSCRHATSSRTKSRDAVREGKRERCEGMPRTRLKRASHGCMYIRHDRAAGIGTFVLPPHRLPPLLSSFLLLA